MELVRISRNVPFGCFFSWRVRIANAAVLEFVEFVPKTDPMVTRPLHWRRDVYDDDRLSFEAATVSSIRVLGTRELQNGRTPYHLGRMG